MDQHYQNITELITVANNELIKEQLKFVQDSFSNQSNVYTLSQGVKEDISLLI